MSPARATLVLLGLRCSGKSTIGGLLATALGRAFVDLDDEVLRLGRRAGWSVRGVGELLERAGAARFRDLEANALRRVLESSPRIVLATGGGAVERADNRAWLERTAWSLYLSVPIDRLIERLRADPTPRPALLGMDAALEMGELLARRDPFYRALAQEVIECGSATPTELVPRILGVLEPFWTGTRELRTSVSPRWEP